MAWTTPRTWVLGEIITAAIMNTHVRDNLNYMYNKPRVKTSNTTAPTYSNGGGWMVHNQEIYDTNGMFTPSSQNVIINTAGVYAFGLSWSHVNLANVGVRGGRIYDGVKNVLRCDYTSNGTQAFSVEMNGHHYFAQGTIVTHSYYHNHGSNLTGTRFQSATPIFWETWMGV